VNELRTKFSLRILLFGAAIVCACASGAFGQAKQPAAAKDEAPTTPPEKLQSLIKALAGRWSTQEKYEPGFLTPDGGTGRGETVFRAGPGGFTLVEEYRAETPAGKLFGLGVIWFDAARGLQHIWCINVYPDGCEMFPPPPQPGPQWDGKTLVLHFESEQGGKKLVFHEVFSDITHYSLTQTVTIGDGEAPPKLWLTIHSTRVGEASTPAATKP
jgi:hypothetical protein